MTEPSKVIHVRNVGHEISENDLLQLFQPFGVITKLVMLRAKNQALLQMQDIPSAINALQFYTNVQPTIRGRNVYVQFSSHQELTTMDQNAQGRGDEKAKREMAKEIDGFKFEQQHGKARVRVARVWRSKEGRHFMVEWNVSISLLSDCVNAYTQDDNSDIVATDTMKNTVYAKAKECKEQLSVEEFAVLLAKHFTTFYRQVTSAIVRIVEKPWERVYVDGQPHEHGFKLGSEKHTTEVIVQKSGALQMISGVEGLALLKTTKSGFEGFVRDKYTALPDTQERMLATEVTGSWRYSYESIFSLPHKPLYFTERYLDVTKILMDTFFGSPKEGVYSPSVQATLYQMAKAVLGRFHDISSVQLKMPNIHFLPVNLTSKDKDVIVKFEDDVYLPTDEPHGSIEATLSRFWSKM